MFFMEDRLYPVVLWAVIHSRRNCFPSSGEFSRKPREGFLPVRAIEYVRQKVKWFDSLERNGRIFGGFPSIWDVMVANLVGDGLGKDCFDFWAPQSGGTWTYLLPPNSSNQTERRAQMNHGTPQNGSFTLDRPRTKLRKQMGYHFLVFMNNTGVSYCLSIHFVPVPKASLFSLQSWRLFPHLSYSFSPPPPLPPAAVSSSALYLPSPQSN